MPEMMEEVVSPSLARNTQQAAPVVQVLTVVGVTPPSEHESLSNSLLRVRAVLCDDWLELEEEQQPCDEQPRVTHRGRRSVKV